MQRLLPRGVYGFCHRPSLPSRHCRLHLAGFIVVFASSFSRRRFRVRCQSSAYGLPNGSPQKTPTRPGSRIYVDRKVNGSQVLSSSPSFYTCGDRIANLTMGQIMIRERKLAHPVGFTMNSDATHQSSACRPPLSLALRHNPSRTTFRHGSSSWRTQLIVEVGCLTDR